MKMKIDRRLKTFCKMLEVKQENKDKGRTELFFKDVYVDKWYKSLWNKLIYIPHLRRGLNLTMKGRGSRKVDGNQSNLSPYSKYCTKIGLYFRIDSKFIEKLGYVDKWYKDKYKGY